MDRLNKALVIREDSLEYKTPLTRSVNVTKIKSNLTRPQIRQKVLQREEFRRPENKEKVLDEDDYLNILETLIQKDYFPDLYQQNEAKRLSKKLEDAKSVTGNRSAISEVDFADKINKEYESLKSQTSQEINLENHSIDSFMTKFSSDELESLKDIFHKDKVNRLNKQLWMYETEDKANQCLKALKEYSEEYLKLPCEPEKHFKKPRKEFAEYDAKNSLFFPPDYSNTNNRADRSIIKTYSAVLGEENNKVSEESFTNPFVDSNKNEKEIVKENTRLPANFVESLVKEHSIKVRRKLIEAYENSDVVKLLKELKEIDDSKGCVDTPNINGYRLIKEPKATPGEIDKVPLFTWGELASTPNVLNENKFTIPQTPAREDLAHSLATKKKKDDKTKTMHLVKDNKLYSLTPRAMQLLDTVKNNNKISSVRRKEPEPSTVRLDRGSTPLSKSSVSVSFKVKKI